MNEPTNLFNGYSSSTNIPLNPYSRFLIYYPGGRELDTKSIGLDVLYSNGFNEFAMHNVYAMYQTKATYDYLFD